MAPVEVEEEARPRAKEEGAEEPGMVRRHCLERSSQKLLNHSGTGVLFPGLGQVSERSQGSGQPRVPDRFLKTLFFVFVFCLETFEYATSSIWSFFARSAYSQAFCNYIGILLM